MTTAGRIAGIATLALLAALTGCKDADRPETACKVFYPNGRAPELHPAPKHTVEEMRLRTLCNPSYAVLYSSLIRGPIVSSERVTKEAVLAARDRPRVNDFQPDGRLEPAERTELADWRARGICIQRGHLANNADAPTPEDASNTFKLSNMVAQDSDNNERLWLAIERWIRRKATRNGEIYVASGPVFKGQGLMLNNRVYIPSFLFKAFYVPSTGDVGVFVTRNSTGLEVASVSLDKLQEWAGIDAFPGIPPELRHVVAPMPGLSGGISGNPELAGKCKPLQIDGGPMPRMG